LQVVNRWFNNKPWEKMTQADIKQVYDALEDGKIITRLGKPVKDKRSYYNIRSFAVNPLKWRAMGHILNKPTMRKPRWKWTVV
jgi:hypothetical protein